MKRYKEALIYCPGTGEFYNRHTRGRARKWSRAGAINAAGYLKIKIFGKDIFCHRLAWWFIYDEWPAQIDHKNCRKIDNRIINLRPATNSQNGANKGMIRSNTSGYRGVTYHRASGLWRGECQKDGKKFSAGYHNNPEDASLAVRKLRSELHRQYDNSQYRKTEGT